MEVIRILISSDGQGVGRMIVNASFQDGIEIRKRFLNFIRYFCNHPDFHRVGQTRKDTRDFIGMEKHGPSRAGDNQYSGQGEKEDARDEFDRGSPPLKKKRELV